MTETAEKKRLFVLDTNVLMHDPTALFRFKEHDIFLPMVVLEELDKGKKGMSEVARNVRQASRFLDDIVARSSKSEIDHGLPIPNFGSNEQQAKSGRLFFQTRSMINHL
ncbi:MAG TPA: PhoH family protein, partial [Thiolapillus brandeum]|nr:PhoH family protein [Thiolapillus brandeum]